MFVVLVLLCLLVCKKQRHPAKCDMAEKHNTYKAAKVPNMHIQFSRPCFRHASARGVCMPYAQRALGSCCVRA